MTYLSEVIADSPLHYWRLADAGGCISYDLGSTKAHLWTGIENQPYSGPNSDGGALASNGTVSPGTALQSAVLVTPVTFEIVCWGGLNFSGAPLIRFFGGSVPMGIEVAGPGTGWQIRTPAGLNSSSVDMAIHQWNHVVLTYDDTTWRLYVNAFLQHTLTSGNGSKSLDGQIQIGGGSSPRLILAEAAIYHTALSAGRVTTHYTNLDNLSSNPITRVVANSSQSNVGGDLSAILAAVKRQYFNAV